MKGQDWADRGAAYYEQRQQHDELIHLQPKPNCWDSNWSLPNNPRKPETELTSSSTDVEVSRDEAESKDLRPFRPHDQKPVHTGD
jgi:hypothetical protein